MRIIAVYGLCLLLALCGCGSERLSPAALAARKELQLERPQKALDQLSAEPVDDSPEAHYLKAIALERLERIEAAKGEAKLAADRAPKNPKYAGLSLRLKLFDGDDKAIEPLLQLHDENPSSAAVSLCSVYAFQAKHVRQRTEGKLRAARVQLEKAQASLSTALSLSAEIPECHRELIGLAQWFEQPTDALKLIDGLLHEEPGHVDLLRDKVKVLVMAKRVTEAIRTASDLYKRLERTEGAAVEFANTLNRLPPSPAVFEQYADLRDHFPRNTSILLRHCWSLGKSGQIATACETLGTAFEQQSDLRQKRLLAESAVAIPLEMKDADIAEQQLKRFRQMIQDQQLLDYLEGQLAYLKKDFGECYAKMQSVLEAGYRRDTASREMAHAALQWIRQLVSQQTLTDQIRKAAELTLRRSSLNREDESTVREDARSLLQLLEAHERSDEEADKKGSGAASAP